MTNDEEPSSLEGCRATRQEIEAAIKGLTPANILRLRRLCQYWLFVLRHYGGCRDTVDDLLQSAITKTLEDTRHWNKAKVDFVGLLAGIIQSDASHALDRYSRGEANMEPITESEMVRVTEDGDDHDPLDRIARDLRSPESELVDRESSQEKTDLVGKVLTLFENDVQASDVLLHRLNELKGPEIQKLMGITKKEYATIDQRIRRGCGKLFGAGDKHEH